MAKVDQQVQTRSVKAEKLKYKDLTSINLAQYPQPTLCYLSATVWIMRRRIIALKHTNKTAEWTEGEGTVGDTGSRWRRREDGEEGRFRRQV